MELSFFVDYWPFYIVKNFYIVFFHSYLVYCILFFIGLLKGIKSVSKELTDTILLLPHSFGQELITNVTDAAVSAITSTQKLVQDAVNLQG